MPEASGVLFFNKSQGHQVFYFCRNLMSPWSKRYFIFKKFPRISGAPSVLFLKKFNKSRGHKCFIFENVLSISGVPGVLFLKKFQESQEDSVFYF